MRGNSHPTSKLPPGSSLIVRKTPPWWSCGAVTSSERPSSLILLAGSSPRKRCRRPFYFELRGRHLVRKAVVPHTSWLRGRHLVREAVVPYTSCGVATSQERPSSLLLRVAGPSPRQRGRRPLYFLRSVEDHSAIPSPGNIKLIALIGWSQNQSKNLWCLR